MNCVIYLPTMSRDVNPFLIRFDEVLCLKSYRISFSTRTGHAVYFYQRIEKTLSYNRHADCDVTTCLLCKLPIGEVWYCDVTPAGSLYFLRDPRSGVPPPLKKNKLMQKIEINNLRYYLI